MFNRLKNLFLDKNIAVAGASKTPPEGYFLPLSAADLLSLPHRKKMLRQIWDNSSLPEDVYAKLYLAPLKDLTSAVQNVPAASQGEWRREGGYIDLTLQYCAYSVRLAKGYMFPPGASPEEQSAQNSLWNAIIFWSALFSHLPLLNRYSGELLDGRQWLPGVTTPDSPYRFKVVGNEVIDNGIATAGLVASRLLPQEGYAWLAANPEAWRVLASFIYHDSTAMPAINEILLKARELVNSPQKTSLNPVEPCSVMQHAIPISSMDTPKEELSSLLNASTTQDTAATTDEISGLVSTLTQNSTPDNKTEASKSGSATQHNNDTDVLLGLFSAVDPSSAEDNETALMGVSVSEPLGMNNEVLMPELNERETVLKLASAAMTNEQCAIQDGMLNQPVNNVAAQERETTEPCEQPLPLSTHEPQGTTHGEKFIKWVSGALLSEELTINQPDSLLHLISGFIFISLPGTIFKYIDKCDEHVDKKAVQLSLEKMKILHTRNDNRFFKTKIYQNDKFEGKFQKRSGYMIKAVKIIPPEMNLKADSKFITINE
ncbi:helicase (plasmid) [Duffyella gerundensis]|uniref:TraI domain-containing protein n=1 Tax=Duffyella gerundensis TaxID=1619313 RepID=UPI001CE306E9|nr:TraI domain-containing protein [Duffyella gerundensis]UCB33471.1 helicase [Duffyella gerundensis]